MKTDYDLLQNLRFGASVFVGQNKNDSYLSDTDVFTNPSRYTRTVNPTSTPTIPTAATRTTPT